jgi:hypothetical protein
MNTGIYPFTLTFAEEQLVDVPVAQQASPSRVELSIPVEISSSSPSEEAKNSPEMSLPIQPEPPSPPRAQSPAGLAETLIPTEVDPTPFQPEAHELPTTTSTPSDLEASALPGAPSSPVIVPIQGISREVLTCTYLCYLYILAPLTRQYCFLGSGPVVIKPAIGEQSSCRGNGRSAPTSIR